MTTLSTRTHTHTHTHTHTLTLRVLGPDVGADLAGSILPRTLTFVCVIFNTHTCSLAHTTSVCACGMCVHMVQGFALSATDCGGDCDGMVDAAMAFAIIGSILYCFDMVGRGSSGSLSLATDHGGCAPGLVDLVPHMRPLSRVKITQTQRQRVRVVRLVRQRLLVADQPGVDVCRWPPWALAVRRLSTLWRRRWHAPVLVLHDARRAGPPRLSDVRPELPL